jgi:hypothetical protein
MFSLATFCFSNLNIRTQEPRIADTSQHGLELLRRSISKSTSISSIYTANRTATSSNLQEDLELIRRCFSHLIEFLADFGMSGRVIEYVLDFLATSSDSLGVTWSLELLDDIPGQDARAEENRPFLLLDLVLETKQRIIGPSSRDHLTVASGTLSPG